MKKISLKSLDLGFGSIEFGNRFVICRIREGSDLAAEHMDDMFGRIEQQFDGPYTIILDDLHPYSMRFEALTAMKLNARLDKVAVVAYRLVTHGVAKMSMHIIGKDYHVFDSLDEAIGWVQGEQ